MQKPWLKNYPKGIPEEIDPSKFQNIVEVFENTCTKFGTLSAFKNMGGTISFNDLDCFTYQMAAFLTNHFKLKKNDRIAIQLPNLLQTPIAIFGALRAGLIVVNTNPLYTAREMKHQFNDSGAKAIIILAHFASQLEEILEETPIEHIIITEAGDCLPFPKNLLVNAAVKYIKRAVPAYNIPGAISYKKALELGKAHALNIRSEEISSDDLAFIQYTGGTTGVSKGAMLTHRNVVANMEQIGAWLIPQLREGVEQVITALPLYHIFSLTVNCLALMKIGSCNILITNPRDIANVIKELCKHRFTVTTGVNTLFIALMNHRDFSKIDWSTNKVSVAGGMALQKSVTDQWYISTGQTIVEGYGLTEASPVVTCNPLDGKDRVGSIGLPLPSTEIKLVDEDGKDVSFKESGELCVRGPQVMKGYWQQEKETKQVLSEDGWLKTGDVAVFEDDGYLKIIDRKKDMILVSGFNVYPNEIEDVLAKHPDVLEVAAVGVADDRSGEAVCVFIVPKDDKISKSNIIEYCKKYLVAYKVPKYIEFRKTLPKSHIGKILKRALK